jgi:Rps23 Pro-64 3,4-dihydroxylase Tpa1-like proline 4-hydroxylase
MNDSYNSKIKVDESKICDADLSIFGSWINEDLSDKFQKAEPFPHILIPNFLTDEYAQKLRSDFANPDETWYKYFNPIEVKFANDKNFSDSYTNLINALSHKNIIHKMSEMTGIKGLCYDEYLHGAGLHAHPRGGFLNMHLDYEKHPINGKERRLNIILYLVDDDWEESWNGDTQLWDKDMKECVVKSFPKFNYAIIFRTNDISWHGMPNTVLCPEGRYRKTFAYYYVSPFENEKIAYRYKAKFVKRPEDENDDRMEKLYAIRPNRRITDKDMEEIWPEWNGRL